MLYNFPKKQVNYLLKENNIVHSDVKRDLLFGSGSYYLKDWQLVKRNYYKELQTSKEIWQEKEKKRKQIAEFKQTQKYERMNKYLRINWETDEVSPKKEREGFRLNKKKVREKCAALFSLDKARTFLAFYSISFPAGWSDDDGITCLNQWLTRLRKEYGLTHYLWVAERQKNGTIHFHLLTTERMTVKKSGEPLSGTNGLLAKIIDYQITKKGLNFKFEREKYNGVDVREVKNRKNLASYLTKYVSKNNTEMKCLCYHSSRSVSQLFTAICIPPSVYLHEELRKEIENVDTYTVDGYCKVEFFNVKQKNGEYYVLPDKFYQLLNLVNSFLIKEFEKGRDDNVIQLRHERIFV